MHRARCVLWLLLPLWLGACSLRTVQERLDAPLALAVLVGTVEAQGAATQPVRLAAWRLAPGGPQREHDVLLRRAGDFELFVPAGHYRVLAFADANGNARADEGEAWAGAELSVQAAAWQPLPTLHLRHAPLPDLLAAAPAFTASQDSLAGALADLDAPRYARRYSLDRGYWQGADFLREMGSNVHALAPHDPARIPVLFVYGARGDPQDWRETFARLDTRRYQAWFYHYPSGVPARITSALLARKLTSLHAMHRFARLHVVAHSAGGLLVRQMLVQQPEAFPWLDRFVTVSTPWGGETIAATGLQRSPIVVPAWADLAPQGEFLRALYARPLPGQVRHLLLYGQRSGWPLFRRDSDGSIPLSSLLDARALAGACHRESFEETHRSILRSADFHRRLDALLSDGCENWGSTE